MKTYALRCLAPDGTIITESREFPTVQAAWDRSSDMGSRWFFYPIHVVTGPGAPGIHRPALSRIIAVPHGMDAEWKGRALGTLAKALAADSQHAADYCNGLTPLCVSP